MNKSYKILFLICFIFTLVFSYMIISGSQFFVSYFEYLLLFLICLLIIVFYIYNIILIFKNKSIKLTTKELSVPIIFIVFSLLIVLLTLIIVYRFSSFIDIFVRVGCYYMPFSFIPCIINLIWTYLIFRNKKEESEDKKM